MASDEIPTPPPDDCEGAQLETLRDVRKAVASCCRLLKAGHLDPQRAGVLMNGYAVLLKSLQDARDSKWLPRVKQLWAEKQKAQSQPEAH
jgi:hypothetical protein